MTKDSLSICSKCGGDACYVTPMNAENNNYFCFGCGFQTNDFMIMGQFDFETYEETLPELYKDIKVSDGDKRVWYPITINIEDKGTVFAKGTTLLDWQWAGVKVKEVSKEEQDKFKIPGTDKSYKYKTDMKTMKEFGKNDFMDALEYIGFFKG